MEGNRMKTTELNSDRLVTDLKCVIRDAEELMAATANVAGEKAHELRERLGRTLDAAKAACRRLQERAVGGVKATDKVIRANPYQSIGVAFGIGILMGVLVTRGRD